MSRILFGIARSLSRSRLFGSLVGFGFEHLSCCLPVRRVFETERVICFEHPRPAFSDHLLLVPRRSIPDLPCLLREANIPCWIDILTLARRHVAQHGHTAYSLGVNGGGYQDVAQVHFHLYSEDIHWRPVAGSLEEPVLETGRLTVYRHPNPARDLHLVTTRPISVGFSELTRLIEDHDLRSGYTVFCEFSAEDTDRVTLHLVAGDRRA